MSNLTRADVVHRKSTVPCVRACHDCPFRADIAPYQSAEDVLRNFRFVTNPAGDAVCHHSAHPGRPLRICAGYVASVRQWMPPFFNVRAVAHGWFDRVRKDVPVFPTLFDFLRRAACPDQSHRGRYDAWLKLQPPVKQARERLRLASRGRGDHIDGDGI